LPERKANCWEFRYCGRGPGGALSRNGGLCAAAFERRTDGVNSGRNGGRACWAIAGTVCDSTVHRTIADKIDDCQGCLFYLLVMEEEQGKYTGSEDILRMLRRSG
jgi:hypothetical protein